ncbi:hypothetical protein BREVNS_1742 [Brevinematales bacterium NS]|nr:type III-A CRISPR-associated RAMP protein Csm5 [Brevinematales bacterium]QJR22492.1 hypothetical protein BREVNS_1742 [Brevinematales bacterium NS]
MIRYTMEFTPLGALHIGTGNVLSPLEYTVKEGQFIRFSLEKLVSSLSEQKRKILLQKIDKNDLTEIILFIQENIMDDCILYQYRADKDFVQKFQSKIADPVNQLLVYEMYKDPLTFEPVIPGSSIKGALRTAIVNTFAERQRSRFEEYLRRGRDFYKSLEKEILGYQDDIRNDPFRCIRVSDCRIEKRESVEIGEIVNYKPSRKNSFASIQLIGEYICGYLLGYTHSYKFIIEENNDLFDKDVFATSFSLSEMLKDIDYFYKRRFSNESKKFYKDSLNSDIKKMRNDFLNYLSQIKPEQNEFLIRLGRYSHVESMTLDLRLSLVGKPHPKAARDGTSRMLSLSSCFPFGWAKLRVVDIKKV